MKSIYVWGKNEKLINTYIDNGFTPHHPELTFEENLILKKFILSIKYFFLLGFLLLILVLLYEVVF